MDFEKENVVDLLWMVLHSLRYPNLKDSLSDDEIDKALEIVIKKQKVFMNETIGAKLRNLLSPYATLINVLEDLSSSNTSLKNKNRLLQYIMDDKNIKLFNNNLEDLKSLSIKLDNIVEVKINA